MERKDEVSAFEVHCADEEMEILQEELQAILGDSISAVIVTNNMPLISNLNSKMLFSLILPSFLSSLLSISLFFEYVTIDKKKNTNTFQLSN